MFDFLLQRFGKKQPDQELSAENKKNAQQEAVNEARQAAIFQAEQLPEEENEAAAFILQSSFADARFIAAQKIHSRVLLEQIRIAMRNTDRRVMRLMQAKLDELVHLEKQQEQIQTCMNTADRLVNEICLPPNLVADLDREWGKIIKTGLGETALLYQYDLIRQNIDKRLSEQTALQQEIREAIVALKCLEDEESSLTPSERKERLDGLLTQSGIWSSSREWPSLPRHLVVALEEAITYVDGKTDAHIKRYAALSAREILLEEWENADIASLNLNELRSDWASLPLLDDSDHKDVLQARFHVLEKRLDIEIPLKKPSASEQERDISELKTLFSYSLILMKQAIQDGAIHEASQQNDQISCLDFSVFEPLPEQKALLAELRAELKKLIDWAKWGSQTSREELLCIVEALPGQDYPIDALAAAVVDAREKWKALNTSSGMASKIQWQQFDAACNRAYEPVLEYARSQALLREQNILKAESLIDMVREALSVLNLATAEEEGVAESMDWRQLLDYQRRTIRAWKQLGPIVRKEKKRLDSRFEEVMQPLNELIKTQTKLEIEKRQALIAEVKQLDPEDSAARGAARLLQERWQERAKTFPLDNREDQKLWQQFRHASESIFAYRAKVNEELEKERLNSFHEKEKICEKLEIESAETIEKIQQLLKDCDTKWHAVGPVSKDNAAAIQARYAKAAAVLLARIRKIRDEEKEIQLQVFIKKLGICQKLERAIPEEPECADTLSILWETLPADERDSLLDIRYQDALKALQEKDATYARNLKSRQSDLMEQLIKLEVLSALDSPPELTSERRRIQMDVLKDSLSGNRDVVEPEQLNALCMLPVLTDERSAERMIRLIKKMHGLPFDSTHC